MERPGRTILRLLGIAAFVFLVIAFICFMLIKLGAAPPVVLLGGPNPMPEERAQLIAEYGLNQPAVVQFIRYVVRTLAGEFGRSWQTGATVADDLLARLPATLELMVYALLLGALIGIPAGVAAAFSRGRAEERTARGAGLVGAAMPSFLLALLLLLVFFRWLDLSPAPSGRLSVVLTPPPTITGSYFIDAILMQDAAAARSALGQLILPVLTLALLIAAQLTLQVRTAILMQLDTAHFAYARAQGMSRDMLTGIAMRGAAPSIWAAFCGQCAALLGTTAVIEYVFAWGGVGQYGLEAMSRGDFAVMQAFILLSAALSLLVHLMHAGVRRVARLRIRRA